jgi:hypothetical protein
METLQEQEREQDNGLERELSELKGFVADLKADRAAQKDKEKRESWTKYTSMSLVFIAVLAAIATQQAGKFSSRVLVELNNATFDQAKASDAWSFYQAKSIKQNLYEGLNEVAPKDVGGTNTNGNGNGAFKAKVAKYESEKAGIKADAEKLQGERDAARAAAKVASEHGAGLGLSISIFQIAIALGSICLVTKKQPLWYISMVLAAVATVKMVMVLTT